MTRLAVAFLILGLGLLVMTSGVLPPASVLGQAGGAPTVGPGTCRHGPGCSPIQHLFNLAALPGMDPRPGNLIHAFDFSQRPLSPLVLQPRTCSA